MSDTVRDNDFRGEAHLVFGGPCPSCGQEFPVALTQYQLLHHAATLARQLEAAGVPEANEWQQLGVVFWRGERASVGIQYDFGGNARWFGNGADDSKRFRVGDPLPPALIQAIRETA